MKWPQPDFESVCSATAQRDPTRTLDGEFRYIDIAAVDKKAKRIVTTQTLRGAQAPSRARKEVRAGDVLVSTVRPNLNAVALVPDDLDGEIASTGFCVLRANRKLVEPRWIFYRCLTTEFVAGLVGQMRGANYPAVSDGAVKSSPLPLPAPSEQRRIVELLEQSDALRRQRAEADALTAGLLPALFRKTFGDPATNPKQFPTMRLRDLTVKFSDGPFGSNLKSDHYVANGVRVVRLQNIGVGKFIDDDKAYIAEAHFAQLAKHECRPGDVLIGTLGDPNLRACIQPDSIPLALNKADCVQARANPELSTPEFLCWLLNSPSTLAMAGGLIAGQTRPRISMGRLAELVVPRPPVELQRRFSASVNSLTATLCNAETAATKIETLFQTMLHRAFSGELTARWRESRMKELLAEMEQQSRLLNSNVSPHE